MRSVWNRHVVVGVFLAIWCNSIYAVDSPTFLNTHYSLDTVVHGDSVAIVYPFVNTTGDTIVVDDIQTNCGCLAAVDGGSAYGPGDTGEVTVTFSSTGQHTGGTHELPVIFRAPDDTTRQRPITVVLSFSVPIRHEIRFTPPLLCGLHTDNSPAPVLAGAIVNESGTPVQIVSLSTDSMAQFEILTRQLPLELAPSDTLPFTVALQPGTTPREIAEVAGTIRALTRDTKYGQHACSVYWYFE